MELQINTIITLSNNEKYIILSEATFFKDKYFRAIKMDEAKGIESNNIVIFREEIDDLDIYVRKVIDDNLLEQLTKLF